MLQKEAEAINENRAIEHLKVFYPSLQEEISRLSEKNNFAGIIQSTVDYTKSLLRESKITIVSNSLKMMDWLYKNGNLIVKKMIENLYIRSFGSFRKSTDDQKWNLVYEYMPIEFQQIYLNQLKLDEIMFKRSNTL